MKAENNLAVFDFDWSLIEQDSDYWTLKQFATTQWQEYESSNREIQWTDFIDQVLCQLQDQGVEIERLEQRLQKIPFTPAMIATLKSLNEHGTKVVIMSDANTFFIDTILKAYGVSHLVHDIITNPAYYDEKNRIRVNRRVLKTDPQHQCPNVCAVNICKGQELDKYIQMNGPFRKIMYVGDGKNDFCPATRLRENDRMFVRVGKGLYGYLQNDEMAKGAIKAKVTYWETSDIVQQAVDTEIL
ncbi:unnamed protein product [Cunninghamella echinulata]